MPRSSPCAPSTRISISRSTVALDRAQSTAAAAGANLIVAGSAVFKPGSIGRADPSDAPLCAQAGPGALEEEIDRTSKKAKASAS